MSDDHDNANKDAGPLGPIERALSGFSPASPQIDRDRLMFLAGQAGALASGSRQAPGQGDISDDHATGKLTLPARRARNTGYGFFWPASTAALAATSLALAAALALRPVPQPLIVYRDRPAETPTAAMAKPEAPGMERATVPITLAAGSDFSPGRVPANNYLRTREVALRMGLDAIGSPAVFGESASGPATYRDLLEGLTTSGQSPNPAARLENSPQM